MLICPVVAPVGRHTTKVFGPIHQIAVSRQSLLSMNIRFFVKKFMKWPELYYFATCFIL